MKKILFPTDFSDSANNAFLYALNLAKTLKAEVLVLHVYDLPMITGSINAGVIQNVYETIETGSFENFKDNIPHLKEIAKEHDLSEIPIKFILEEGNFLYNLKKLTEEEEIDFVVMGTEGNNGLQKLLFGSNTINAITSLKIPVLSVPQDISFKSYDNIGFTTIFEDRDKEALKYLIKMANRHKAKIHCMHVSKDGSYDNKALKEWKIQFENEPVIFEIITDSDPVNAVINAIDDKKLDLLTVVRRNKGFLDKIFSPSFTKTIVNKNIIPLFVFQEQDS